MKVLVLDLVHGGKTIAEKFLQNGDDVTAVDVYLIAGREVTGGLSRRGVRVLDSPPEEDFDLCAMPCHCPESFIGAARCGEVIDFSQAVNRLFDPYDRRFRVEVTGVKGKTSLCFVLAHILDTAGRKVYVHSSHGMGPYHNGRQIITDYQSTAPPSLLELPRTEYDVVICEVSLGGSGRADIAAITNLAEDYPIAAGTKKASSGKKDILTSGVNIVRPEEKDTWGAYGHPVRTVSKRVSVVGPVEAGKPPSIAVDYRGRSEIILMPGYLALQYLDAFDMALEICDAMDIPQDDVVCGLASFPGAPGRGKVSVRDGVVYVCDRNPGVSMLSLKSTADILARMGISDGIVMQVSMSGDKVCDGLDMGSVEDFAASRGFSIVPEGQGLPEGTRAVIHAVKELYQ